MSKSRFSVYALSKIYEDWGDGGEEFCVQVHIEIKEEGARGGEAFMGTVASPSYLARILRNERNPIELGRGYIFTCDYDERVLISAFQTLVDGTNAEDWSQLTERFGKYFNWIE